MSVTRLVTGFDRTNPAARPGKLSPTLRVRKSISDGHELAAKMQYPGCSRPEFSPPELMVQREQSARSTSRDARNAFHSEITISGQDRLDRCRQPYIFPPGCWIRKNHKIRQSYEIASTDTNITLVVDCALTRFVDVSQDGGRGEAGGVAKGEWNEKPEVTRRSFRGIGLFDSPLQRRPRPRSPLLHPDTSTHNT